MRKSDSIKNNLQGYVSQAVVKVEADDYGVRTSQF